MGPKRWIPAVIVKQHSDPRSYVVQSQETGDIDINVRAAVSPMRMLLSIGVSLILITLPVRTMMAKAVRQT